MATIRRETVVEASPDTAWDALRDVGALHTRLVPGFVVATSMEDDARVVTFANGMVVRERIVTVDDDARRVVWSATGGALTHHNGSAQVIAEGPRRCRFVWLADLLPDEAAPAIAAMMDQGIAVIRDTLERAERERAA